MAVIIKTTFYLTLSNMNDLLFTIHGLMKVGLVISVLVLVSTWPGRASAAAAVIQQCGLLFAGLAAVATGAMRLPITDEPDTDSQSAEPSDLDSEVSKPLFNIDGTPMFGDIDANGNPYGLVGSPFDHWHNDTWSQFDD